MYLWILIHSIPFHGPPATTDTTGILALCMLDIDRFKDLNEQWGQPLADQFLRVFAQRLRADAGPDNLIGRIGGDEFAILLHSLNSNPQSASHTARIVANKVQQALNIPVVIDDNEVRVTVSMGLTLFPDASDDSADEVIKRADNALHKAKNKGGNQALFFESEMGIAAEQYFQIERNLVLSDPHLLEFWQLHVLVLLKAHYL